MFKFYWSQGTYVKRLTTVKSLISLKAVARRRKGVSKVRKFTAKYMLRHEHIETNVCRKCFGATLGESEGFIQHAVNQKWKDMSQAPDEEKRGKRVPKNKTPDEKIEEIKQHIDKFPAYQSHYTRRHTSKKYLPIGLTIQKMYDLYKTEVVEPVKYGLYATVFRETGLKFKQPQLDRCTKCDLFAAKLKYTSFGDGEKEEIERLKD